MSQEATYQETYPKLFALAYRMTGSVSDAEDVIQEAWTRLLDQPKEKVESPPKWLYRTVSNLAIDTLRSAKRTATGYHGPWLPEPVVADTYFRGPEAEAIAREDISIALLLMLEHLTPNQRAVWVLRTTLELGFAEIGEFIGNSDVTSRQLYRRANKRLKNAEESDVQPASSHLAEAFMIALRSGDAPRLLDLLRDDAVWIGDGGGVRPATMRPVETADKVARGLLGIAARPEGWRVEPTVINGSLGMLVYSDEGIDSAWMFLGTESQVSHVLVVRNPHKLIGTSLKKRIR